MESFENRDLSHSCQYRSAKCFVVVVVVVVVLGGREGQLGRANPRRVPGKKLLKMFEIFIPKIAVNASIFKN